MAADPTALAPLPGSPQTLAAIAPSGHLALKCREGEDQDSQCLDEVPTAAEIGAELEASAGESSGQLIGQRANLPAGWFCELGSPS